MKNLTDNLWAKVEELNTLHKQTVMSIFAIINVVDAVPYEHIGTVIKQKRKERKLSQERMAFAIDCSRNYLAQIEKMDNLESVSFGIVYGIATILDMNLYELVT